MNPDGAGILLVRGDGAFLLLRRSFAVKHAGYWNIPGGGVRPTEEPMTAAFREFQEEAGPLPRARIVATPIHGSFFVVVATISLYEAAHWAPRLNWESNDWGWFLPDQLPEQLYHGLGPFLRTFSSVTPM